MSTSTEFEEEDIFDVQHTNITSVQRMKEVFKEKEKIEKNKLPVKPPVPAKKSPAVQMKLTLNNNRSEMDALILVEKPRVQNKTTERKNVALNSPVTPHRISDKLLNNPFFKQNQNPLQTSHNSRPVIPIKTWKTPEANSLKLNCENEQPSKLTTKISKDRLDDVGEEHLVSPSNAKETLPSKTLKVKAHEKLFPQATENEIKNVLSKLKRVTSDENKVSVDESENDMEARTKTAVVPKGMKRDSTIEKKAFKRPGDDITFIQIPLAKLDLNEVSPEKPEKIADFDLTTVIEKYNKQISMLGDGAGYDEDDIYDDVALAPPQERAVSLICPMSEAEEWPELDPDESYDDTAVRTLRDLPAIPRAVSNTDIQVLDPSEDYDELLGLDPVMDDKEMPSDLYEAVDDLKADIAKMETKTQAEETSQSNAIAEDEKISEKERKKREKEEKERQKKELKRKEKEMKELHKKFKINLSILKNKNPLGRIKADMKGSKTDLAVTAGEMVSIIRMSKPNPTGKWLIQLQQEETVGYVMSDNVEVMQDSMENVHQAGTGSDVTGYSVDDEPSDIYDEIEKSEKNA